MIVRRDSTQESSREAGDRADSPRKRYAAPKLREFGTIRQLTAGGSMLAPEDPSWMP